VDYVASDYMHPTILYRLVSVSPFCLGETQFYDSTGAKEMRVNLGLFSGLRATTHSASER
jgi:hypothetical protein